jgi:hypothetical protein
MDFLWDRILHERLVALLAIAVLVEVASASVTTMGRRYMEVFFALQLGLLSCVGLWMAVAARSWTARLVVAIVATGTGLFLIDPSMRHSGAAEFRTILVGHVVIVAGLSLALGTFGLIRSPAKKHGASGARQFNMRQIFAWTTTVAILAYLARYAVPPRSIEVVYFIVGPFLALGIACVMTNVKRIALPVVMLHVAIVLALLVPDRSIDTRIEVLLMFYLVQAVVIVGWICVWRVFEPDWFSRNGFR